MPILAALLLAAAPVAITSDTSDLDFTYAWPAEAEAIPALSRRFRADAGVRRTEMLRMAAAEKAFRTKEKMDWNGLQFSRKWETAGQSRQLLSLVSTTSAYTGGAHPNTNTKSLLWDRRSGREIGLDALLLTGKSWDGAIRQPFCILLNRERAKRRGEPITRKDWPSQCPALKELSLVLADRDKDGRFDHVDVTADAYVAGPYAEGAYEISLPLTATMLTRLRPAYRAGFEPQPPVQ
ncbi:hypothetical protein GGQ97_001900 [Sphingomonas kaistensis]|uniref:Deacetylase PdaC domain-containing protein n=1 Tax=Sphingomonas kaistensis TaxID=298708 RepID=A0A7X5Y7T5_9SPHN|nr:DUF4163 domain-containing protein [Sphingomonas kaistensis]NJC06107.1 hypothetical protein [Sphingomonas kaistensis]